MTNNLSTPQKSQSIKKILILGCGDIGQRLARQLDRRFYQVVGIRRNCPPDSDTIHYRQCDVAEPGALQMIVTEGFDVIVITMTPDERSDKGYERAYVHTCRTLVSVLGDTNRHPLIIFVSSTAVYAQDDGSRVDEKSPCEPLHFSGKRLMEAEAIISHSGFPYSLVRFSGIYGPGRTRLIEQVKQGQASASPHYTNRIHADDCAGFLAHLIELQQPLAPVYIATDSNPAPRAEVVGWITNKLGINDFLSAEAGNERGNKKLCNQLMLASGYQLRYQSYRDGYGELLGKGTAEQ